MTNIDQMAADVAALKRAEDIREGRIQLPDRADYLQACAVAQERAWLLRRSKAEAGHRARESARHERQRDILKAQDRLAKIARERAGAFEKLDAQRRQLTESFDVQERKPHETLDALSAEVDAARKAAEEAIRLEDIEPPKVRLARDDSDMQAAQEAARRDEAKAPRRFKQVPWAVGA